MKSPKYLINPDKLNERMNELNLDEKHLNVISETLYRTIIDGTAVSGPKAERLAKRLGVTVDWLVEGTCYMDGISSFSPAGLDKKTQRQMAKASDRDLRKEYAASIRICDNVLTRLKKVKGTPWNHLAYVRLRKAVTIDNSGDHSTALELFEELLAEPHPSDATSQRLAFLMGYHRGLTLRRLGRLDDAEGQLAGLPGTGIYKQWRAGVNHQLGAVCQQRGNLSEALSHLKEAQKYWQNEHNHREGFSLRRIAHIHALNGDYAASAKCFFEAAVVFGLSRAHRYVEVTRADMEEYVLTKLRWLKPPDQPG